jgi:hypothetical protein
MTIHPVVRGRTDVGAVHCQYEDAFVVAHLTARNLLTGGNLLGEHRVGP